MWGGEYVCKTSELNLYWDYVGLEGRDIGDIKC